MRLHTCPGVDERGCPNVTVNARCPECAAIMASRVPPRGGSTHRWRRRRRHVLNRDGFACVKCGSYYPLEIDHIDGNPDNDKLENLQTLCVPCHKAKHRENPRLPAD